MKNVILKSRAFKIFIVFLLNLAGCTVGKTKLPPEMPYDLIIVMTETKPEKRFASISIRREVMEIEYLESAGIHQTALKKSAKITDSEIERVYRVLAENKFDEIEEQDGQGTTSEKDAVEIKVFFQGQIVKARQKSANLSDLHKKRFQTIRSAILNLAEEKNIDRETQ